MNTRQSRKPRKSQSQSPPPSPPQQADSKPPPPPADNKPPKQAKPWASGRVLTAEQRARKREVDRNAGRFMKKEALDRIAQLESRLLELESRVAQHEELLPGPSSSTDTGPGSPSTSHLDFYDVRQHPAQDNAAHPNLSSATVDPASHATVPIAGPSHHAHPLYSTFPAAPTAPRSDPLTSLIDGRSPQDFFSRLHRALQLPGPTDVQFMPPMNPLGREMTTEFNELGQLVRLMPPAMISTDPAINSDLMIRAVLEGWDAALAPHVAVARVCPLWLILRQVDFWLFRSVSFIPRLTSLYAMHRMYLHMVAQLPIPPWYVASPAQAMLAHNSVIDYLPWPAVREYLVLREEQEHILTNQFWVSYAHSLRVEWPYNAPDAVVLTGESPNRRYAFSEVFLNQLDNVANLSLEPSFRDKFPNLYEESRIERQHQYLFVA